MSLSKISSVHFEHSYARVNKQKKKLKVCCVKNCTNNEEEFNLFTFPSLVESVDGVQQESEENRKRCNNIRNYQNFILLNYKGLLKSINPDYRLKTWVEGCQNEDVILQPLGSLHKNYYICSAHFAENDFIGQKKEEIKAGSKSMHI